MLQNSANKQNPAVASKSSPVAVRSGRMTLKDLKNVYSSNAPLESFGYKKLDLIAEGGYGSVYRGCDGLQQPVALKIMNHGDDKSISQTTLREVALLRSAGRHTNIVQMLDCVFVSHATVMVLELLETDLSSFVKRFRRDGQLMPDELVKSIMRGVLHGTDHLHRRGIAHRDLKPRNVLLDTNYIPKIADFGLSKFLTFPVRAQVENFGTRWYRAPEVLFGFKQTTMRVDMWSIGTIFAEMKERMAIFPGRDHEDQINLICQTLGTPNVKIWPELAVVLPRISLPYYTENRLASKVSNMNATEVEILQMFFHYQPCMRISADKALELPYFQPGTGALATLEEPNQFHMVHV